MGILLILAAYAAYAAFWFRFLSHFFLWWRAMRRLNTSAGFTVNGSACALTALDITLFARLFRVNPALWFGEWLFHATFVLVFLCHLRFFLDPVPGWVWSLQTPGLIAGFILPLSLIYILMVRLLSAQEKYSSPANIVLLGIIFALSTIGVLMREVFRPDIVDVKLFMIGILGFSPAPAPASILFRFHFCLALALLVFIPTHVFTAPLIMFEARKRDHALPQMMHD